ncbi:MAG: CHAT domain-containing protein [Armatimonadetes bacterium]|nr:CHAT domain-containing protein [Armatimonadota bacterium]
MLLPFILSVSLAWTGLPSTLQQAKTIDQVLDDARAKYSSMALDEAADILQQAENRARNEQNPAYALALVRAYQAPYWFLRHAPQQESDCLKELRQFEEETRDQGSAGHLWWRLGWNYQEVATHVGHGGPYITKAVAAFQHSQKVFEKIHGTVSVGDCLIAQAIVTREQREQSIPLLKKAIEAYTLAPNDADIMWGFMNASNLWPVGNDFREVIDLGRSLVDGMLSRHNANTVYAYGHWICWALATRGDVTQSLALGDRFVARLNDLGDQIQAADLLLNQANVAVTFNIDFLAYHYAQDALTTGHRLSNSGIVFRSLQVLDRVLGLSTSELQELLQSGSNSGTLGHIGKLLIEARLAGTREETRKLLQQAIAAEAPTGWLDLRPYWFLADTYSVDSEETQQLFENCLRMSRVGRGMNLWKVYFRLASSCSCAGKDSLAYDYINMCLAGRSHKDGYWLLNPLMYKGLYAERLGKLEEALDCFSRAQKELDTMVEVAPDAIWLQMRWRDNYAQLIRAPLRVLTKLGRGEDAFNEAEAAKAAILRRVALGVIPKYDSKLAPSSELDILSRRWTEAREATDAILAGNETDASGPLHVMADKASRKLQFQEDFLTFRYPAQESKHLDSPELASGRLTPSKVGKDECYISYSLLSKEDEVLTEAQAKRLNLASRIVAFCLDGRTGRISQFVVPENADRVRKLSTDLTQACQNPTGSYRQAASLLYTDLIAPFAKQLAGKSRLIICPDTFLWAIPFGVLQDSSSRRLCEYVDVVLTPSLLTYQILTKTASPSLENYSPLVFADPLLADQQRFGKKVEVAAEPQGEARPLPTSDEDVPPGSSFNLPKEQFKLASYSAPESYRISRGGMLAELPGTRQEANSIAKVFPNAKIFTRETAQEREFKKVASDYRILHLASHGVFNDIAPLYSSIVLSDPDDNSEDGFLTAQEILGMHLKADLVVLSACNTGQGQFISGEGQMGLSWALSAAGAKSKVMSQWAVDDTATAMLIEAFYEKLKEGLSPERSLRLAMESVRKDPRFQHPYYWAAFSVYR